MHTDRFEKDHDEVLGFPDAGRRRYSEADPARLRHIGELTEAGVNLKGVRRILQPEAELAALRAQLRRARAEGGTAAAA